MTIKDKLKSLQTSTSVWDRFIYISAKRLWYCFCVITQSELRNCVLTKIRFGQSYLQRSVFTTTDRYPLLFRACADYIASTEYPKILSFGCATGEEAFSICQYLPHATIMDVDINPWCLRQCRRKSSNPNFTFAHRFSKEFESASNFDAIFCLAVFQRTENRTNKTANISVFPFEKFESEVMLLDKKLKQNGLLIIDHADFNFEETCIASTYQPLLSFKHNKYHRNRPLFDRNNHKIASEHENYRVFVKVSES